MKHILEDLEDDEVKKVLLKLGKKIKHPYTTSIPKVKREYKLWLDSKRYPQYNNHYFMLRGSEYFGAIIEKVFIELEIKMEEI